MKKALCLLLALALVLPCCAAFAVDYPDLDKTAGAIEYPYLGFRFDPPEIYRNTAGIVVMEGPMDLSELVDVVNCSYYAMTEERYAQYRSSHELTIPVNELWIDSLFSIFTVRKGMTFRQYNTFSGSLFSEEEMEHIREIGKVGDTTYYLFMYGPSPDFVANVDPAYVDEYTALSSAVDEVTAGLSFFEAEEEPDPYAGVAGSKIEFTARDLDGNPVSSADLFAGNKVTVLNIWATWCGPCIGELGDLQGIHRRMQEKGVGVVGMLMDDDLDTARELMDEFKVGYPVILAPDTLEDFFPLQAYPSTLFIGPDGTVLTDPVIGAHVERYITILNSLLR